MKKFLKYSLLSFLLGLFIVGTSCENKDFSENFDANFPVPVVSSISKSGSLAIETEIEIKGSNFQRATASVAGAACTVKSIAADGNSMVILLPRIFTDAPITVKNTYGREGVSESSVAPIYPNVTITKVSEIPQGLEFTVEGENVDLITAVFIDNAPATVSKVISSSKIKVSSAGIDLVVGQLVKIAFETLSNNLPTVNGNVGFPTIEYNEVILWDFEDGNHTYDGKGTVTIKSAGANTPPGNVDKYFELRGPGFGWDAETGTMMLNEVPDLSGLINPYLTFYIRTPAGSGGYFQMEDQNGHWRHFDYGWATEGAWKKYSVPLATGWEGSGAFLLSTFKPKLTFKAGNAGTQQDVDIAYVKITEGYYDDVLVPGDGIGNSTYPAKIDLANFEDTSLFPDLKNGEVVVASTTFRHDGADMIAPFNGSQFFTWIDDGTLGNWSGYWGQTLNMNTASLDIKGIPSPWLSFAFNTGAGKGQQYLIIRFFQYDHQLELVTKVFANTEGEWNTSQVDIFNTDLENWSKGDGDLANHFKSLKKLNKDIPIDEIQIIVSRNDANPILVSVDEVTITSGPRYK